MVWFEYALVINVKCDSVCFWSERPKPFISTIHEFISTIQYLFVMMLEAPFNGAPGVEGMLS